MYVTIVFKKCICLLNNCMEICIIFQVFYYSVWKLCMFLKLLYRNLYTIHVLYYSFRNFVRLGKMKFPLSSKNNYFSWFYMLLANFHKSFVIIFRKLLFIYYVYANIHVVRVIYLDWYCMNLSSCDHFYNFSWWFVCIIINWGWM